MNQAVVSYEDLATTMAAVEAASGNITKAAIALGMPRSTVSARVLMAKIRGIAVAKQATSVAETATQKHCVIPDVQAKPGVPLDHLKWAGEYIADKRPDTIICIGDFADMSSLSSYDRHKKSAENKRYKADIEAAHTAMELLMTPIVKAEGYKPRLVLTLGNHEDRITRFVDDNPVLEHSLTLADLGYEAWGWEVIPFKQPIDIDGISYCHFFHPQNSDKPYAGANLQTRLQTIGFSFTMGHQQGLRTAVRDLSNGTRQRGLVAGSFYQHNEVYRGPQACKEWRGILMKHEVSDGDYDLMEVSLNFLRKRYG